MSPSPYLWSLTASLLSFAHHLLFSGFSFSGTDAEWPAGRLVGNRAMQPVSQGRPVHPNEFEELGQAMSGTRLPEAVVFFVRALLLISFHPAQSVLLKSLFTVPWEHPRMHGSFSNGNTHQMNHPITASSGASSPQLHRPDPCYRNYKAGFLPFFFLNQGKHERHC